MNEIPYERVKIARDNGRPTGTDYIKNIFKNFIEFHGDRCYADDKAIVGGIARLNGMPVTVIAIEKGHTAKERSYRNFGAPHPEGYRKALRLMKQAEKFGRPIVCFIDTSGAYCGVEAEERGQALDAGEVAPLVAEYLHGAGEPAAVGVGGGLDGRPELREEYRRYAVYVSANLKMTTFANVSRRMR